MTREQRQAVFSGLFAACLLGVAIFVGSRNLRHIDAALVGYTFACLFAAFGLGYRYAMWLQRPPTRMYWRRGWASFLRPAHFWKSLTGFVTRFVGVFLLNLFIWRRSRPRGLTHLLIMWGCRVAAAVTVIFTLLWLPFGKFFHIFQRPAQLAVKFYQDVGAEGEQASCVRCRKPFASKAHVEDLIVVERELGYRYDWPDVPAGHYQH